MYKRGNTIHGKGILDIEVDEKTGEVVSVWYNCLALPFKAKKVRKERADELRSMYKHPHPMISGITLEEDDEIVVNPEIKLPICKACNEEEVVPGEEQCESCIYADKIMEIMSKHGAI